MSVLKQEEVLKLDLKREDYLLSGIVLELEKEKKFPVVELRDPDTGQLTVANLFAERSRIRRVISNIVNVGEAADRIDHLDVVQYAPVQECVRSGDQVDIMDLPVFRHYQGDAGRYISSGIVLAKDPENGRYNMSFHRMELKGRDRIGMSLHSHGDLYRYFEEAKNRHQDLEIAVVIGCHPAYYITGASKIPLSQDDYTWAGAYMDQVPLVTAAKTVGLLVPAEAEYILEGKLLCGEQEPEGPFAEYTGYSTNRSTNTAFQVTAVTCRRDAIYQDLVPGFAWEHLLLSQFTKEIILLEKVKKEIPEVRAISLPKDGCHFHAYVSMKPSAMGQARQLMMLLFGLDIYLKLIIVVNEDVDVYSEEEVMWAVATHVQADRDVFIVPKSLCNRLDPSSERGMSDKMGIDATGDFQAAPERVKLPEEIVRKAETILRQREEE